MPEGYCVKERKKVEIKDAKQVTMKNGRPAIQGVCPDCGTNLNTGSCSCTHAWDDPRLAPLKALTRTNDDA